MKAAPATVVFGLSRANLRALDDEMHRSSRRLRDLVLKRIRAGEHPSPADVATALREPLPDARRRARVRPTPEEYAQYVRAANRRQWAATHLSPQRWADATAAAQAAIDQDTRELLEYVARHYVLGRSRPPGPKTSSRTLREQGQIAVAYAHALAQAKARHPKNPVGPVKQAVAAQFDMSVRTLETILKNVRANIS